MSALGRRDLLRLAALIGASAALPACGSDHGTAADPKRLDDGEKRDLGVLADAVIPPDPGSPGGRAMGAVAYVEKLLAGAAIFAGGPYSGREPFGDDHGGRSTTFPPNDFANFLELDRVSAAIWKLRLEGGEPPNADLVGEVTSLVEQVRRAIVDARGAAAPRALSDLDEAGRRDMIRAMEAQSRDLVVELVCEAAFSAPEYGGNVDLAGWKLCHFEGDSQPLGFSLFDVGTNAYRERPDAPMSGPNPGPDPDPLDDETRALVTTVVQLEGGKVLS